MLDHKLIGLCYIIFGIFCGFFGSFLSTTIRLELLVPGYFFFSGSEISYNISITSHGIIMIFFAVMPVFISGFGNLLLPFMLGCRDMSLPKINNFAFFLLIFSFLTLNISLGVFGKNIIGVSSGWTVYPPLSLLKDSGSLNLFILSLHLNGLSSLLNSLNTISTIHFCSSISKWHSNLFCWSMIITSYLLLLVIPILIVGITFLLLDNTVGSCFYCVEGGGDPLLFQHLFWLFGHPEVYILMIPSFGLISEFISENTSFKLLGYKVMIWSSISIAVLGCFVWAHHMYTVGMEVDSRCYFTIASSIIAIPTGLKVVLWISSFIKRNFVFNIINLLIFFFLFTFIFGGITGVWLAQSGLDLLLHDTYFVVSHFHYVMALSIIYVFFASIYNWFKLIFGLEYSILLSKLHIFLFFFGSNLIFFPMYVLGIYGMPRRVFDYPSVFIFLNQISTLGLFLSIFSIFIFIVSFLSKVVLINDFFFINFFKKIWIYLPNNIKKYLIIIYVFFKFIIKLLNYNYSIYTFKNSSLIIDKIYNKIKNCDFLNKRILKTGITGNVLLVSKKEFEIIMKNRINSHLKKELISDGTKKTKYKFKREL